MVMTSRRVSCVSATSTFQLVTVFSPVGNGNVTTNDVLTLLSHFPTLQATTRDNKATTYIRASSILCAFRQLNSTIRSTEGTIREIKTI